MILNTIDAIIRRNLLENSMPIHWYAEYLFHSASCLRELHISTLKIINTANLPVGAYGQIDLPDDFDDDVMVSFDMGETLRPIPHKDNINPLRVHSTTTGQFVPQGTLSDVEVAGLAYPFAGWNWYWNVSDYGENTGGMFGANGGSGFGYKVIKERRQIQLSGGYTSGNAILQYVSDGQSIDNMSQIDTKAIKTIQNYIDWKTSPNSKNEFSPEGRAFTNAKRILRGRLNDLTTTDIKDILRSNYTAAIKS